MTMPAHLSRPSRLAFAHRRNGLEESWNAICTRCFRTVGAEKAEAALAKSEKAHKCRGLDLMMILHGVDNTPRRAPKDAKTLRKQPSGWRAIVLQGP
jgi:hypothetical protein